jgi:hypothetical protein
MVIIFKESIRKSKNKLWLTNVVMLFCFLGVACSTRAEPNPLESPLPTQNPAAVPTQNATEAPTQNPTAISSLDFDGEIAFEQLVNQMDFGSRWPGSPAHLAVGDYIIAQLKKFDWEVDEQYVPYESVTARNIIGKTNIGAGPIIIIGAHYDTRRIADQSPEPLEPVPGAVDGASGVAVLLELARTLELQKVEREIWLTFFDVEDQGRGGMPGFAWGAGSRIMADSMTVIPDSVIVVDMVGDADQQLFFEGNSNRDLQTVLWQIAADLGFGERFIPEQRHTMIDDHLPFVEKGIPTSLIIDFDYPYWHTTEDTIDKASPESLFSVGRTLEFWLEDYLIAR